MSKNPLILVPLVSMWLIGCATSDDRGAATGRAIVNTTATVADELAAQNCYETNSGTAREACLNRMRAGRAASKEASKPEPRATFDNLETYQAKRDAELAKSE